MDFLPRHPHGSRCGLLFCRRSATSPAPVNRFIPADRVALPVDQRKVLHGEKGGDPDLEELLFQYDRYLLIACSRPGGLSANLQGLWCDSNKPPWHSAYHANINIQMNYWPAEPANLAECHATLFDLIASQLPAWRRATAAEKRFATTSGKSRGWAVRTSRGIHGDIGWQWDVPANAWYCQHFWWHHAYGGDKAWLKRVAYPVMKETCASGRLRGARRPTRGCTTARTRTGCSSSCSRTATHA